MLTAAATHNNSTEMYSVKQTIAPMAPKRYAPSVLGTSGGRTLTSGFDFQHCMGFPIALFSIHGPECAVLS